MDASVPYLKLILRGCAVTLMALSFACSSTSKKADSLEGIQASGSGGLGTGGRESAAGGSRNSGTAGAQTTAGGAGANGSPSEPPCNPEDNTLTISTGDLLTDLPAQMTFTVFDPPTSKRFTGNGPNGDVRVELPEPAGTDRVFPTATVVDPLDRQSANIELVVASGVLNARYVVETGAHIYAQVTSSRMALTFCDVEFYPASDPPNLPVIKVSGRVVALP